MFLRLLSLGLLLLQPANTLRGRIEATPTLPFHAVLFGASNPPHGWASGTVSGLALWPPLGTDGLVYEIQRGDHADPVVVLDRFGHLLPGFGRGDFALPHSVRRDATGNVWTVDAGSSDVIEYTPLGRKLRTIHVGGQPANGGGAFVGTTDIAFGPNGHVYITDGYGNARVLEYTADGMLVRQWGSPGSGPGQFHLPHSIQIDAATGTIYVADRENGRIEEFSLHGRYTGEIAGLGRVFALKLAGSTLWATVGDPDQPVTSGGWILKLDSKTGQILGHLTVPALGGHGLEVTAAGEPITTLGDHLLWFRRD